jgi:hypothetical protein
MKLFNKLIGIKKEKLYLAELAKIGITQKNEDGTYEPEYFYFIPRRYVVVKKTYKEDIYKEVTRRKKYKQISNKRIDTPGTVVMINKKPISSESARIKYKDAQKIERNRCAFYKKKKGWKL